MTEAVNHPAHYGGEDNPYEVVKVAEAWGFDEDAYLFNVLKYIGRPEKGNYLEDLKKARWYLERKIKRLEQYAFPPEPAAPVVAQARDRYIRVYYLPHGAEGFAMRSVDIFAGQGTFVDYVVAYVKTTLELQGDYRLDVVKTEGPDKGAYTTLPPKYRISTVFTSLDAGDELRLVKA